MNNWNQPPQQPQQPPGNQQAGNNGVLRTGSLLRDYQRQQNQPPQQKQPGPFPSGSQVPNPYSPFPPTPPLQENGQANGNRSGLLSQHRQGPDSPPVWPQAQGWVSNTFQMM